MNLRTGLSDWMIERICPTFNGLVCLTQGKCLEIFSKGAELF